MEAGTSVVTVSYSEPDSELPVIKTIKCEYSNAEEVENYTIGIPETSLEEEESSLDEYAGRKYLSSQNGTQIFATEELNGIFKCYRCNFSCASSVDLISHYQRYREREPFTCFQCGYVGRNKENFINHSRSHFESPYFKCSRCSFRADTHTDIKKHVQEHNKVTSVKVDRYKCPMCEKNLHSVQNLKDHLGKCVALQKDSSDQNSTKELEVTHTQTVAVKPTTAVVNFDENITKVWVKEEPNEENANPVFTCPHCFFIFRSKFKRSKHIYKVHMKDKVPENENEKENDDDNDKIEIEEVLVKKTIKSESNDDSEDTTAEVGPDMNPSVQLERIYLCPICHFVFTSVSSLNTHIVTHKSVTECPICKCECSTNVELREHMTTHSNEKLKFSCTLCEKKFLTLGKLKYHIKDEHSKGLKCPFCPRIIKSESALRVHIEAHSRMKEYYCPKCKFTAKNSSLLQYHMSRYHPPKKKFTCETCFKSYKYRYSLQRHKPNCLGKGMIIATKESTKDGGPTPEIEIDITQKEKLSCSECKASFKEATHLKRHLLIHFHRMPYRCMKCGLRCRTKHNLSEHMKIHNIKAHYQCKLCLKKFKHRHALNNHSIIHSDKRPFTCEVCGMTFKRKANYRRHYDIHSDIKPFKCPYCDFTARRKDGLQKHLDTHSKK